MLMKSQLSCRRKTNAFTILTPLFPGSNYQPFKIVSVATYVKPIQTPWYKTSTGIIVISFSVFGLVFLIAASMSIGWYYSYYRPEKKYADQKCSLHFCNVHAGLWIAIYLLCFELFRD